MNINQDQPHFSRITSIQITLEYQQALWNATLKNGGLDEDVIDHLYNSPTEHIDLSDESYPDW